MPTSAAPRVLLLEGSGGRQSYLVPPLKTVRVSAPEGLGIIASATSLTGECVPEHTRLFSDGPDFGSGGTMVIGLDDGWISREEQPSDAAARSDLCLATGS